MTRYAFIHKWHIVSEKEVKYCPLGKFLCGVYINASDKLVDYHDEPMCKKCKQIQEKKENTPE